MLFYPPNPRHPRSPFFTHPIKPTKILSPFTRPIRVIRVPLFSPIQSNPPNFIPFYPPNPRHPRSFFHPFNQTHQNFIPFYPPNPRHPRSPFTHHPLFSRSRYPIPMSHFTLHLLFSRYPIPLSHFTLHPLFSRYPISTSTPCFISKSLHFCSKAFKTLN